MRRLVLATAATLVLLPAAVPAAAACQLAGRVETGGLPVDGATVLSIRGTESPVEIGRSGADGRFAFDVPPLARDLAALRIVVGKGAAKGDFILKRRGDGCPEPRDVYEIAGLGGNGSATPGSGPAETLCIAPSALGRTVVLAPYQFFGPADAEFSRRFNADLPRILFHRILAFQSRLGSGGGAADITVEPVCSPLSVADGERIRRIGGQLNALAVVVGEGEVVQEADGGPQVELDSVFRTIPIYGGHGGSPVTIGDKLPGDRLRPSQAAEWLDDAWGKQVLYAYALRQLEGGDPTRLETTRQLLVDMRKTMTAGDPFLPPLEALIATVEREIGP